RACRNRASLPSRQGRLAGNGRAQSGEGAVCAGGTRKNSGSAQEIRCAVLQRIHGRAAALGAHGERGSAEGKNCGAIRAGNALSGADEERPGVRDGDDVARGNRTVCGGASARSGAAALVPVLLRRQDFKPRKSSGRMNEKIKKASRHTNQSEGLIFEQSSPGKRAFELPGLDVPKADAAKLLGGRHRKEGVGGFPEVSEIEVIRHFTRLSTWNYAIDLGMYPLGSCTMKYNPRVNEFVARL